MSEIAKYRESGYPGRWWLTDFTMGQIEQRLNATDARLAALERVASAARILTTSGAVSYQAAIGQLVDAIAKYDEVTKK